MLDDRSPASPLRRAWRGTSRAHRLLAAAALGAVALTGGAAVLLAEDEDEPLARTTTAAASAAASASAVPSPSPSPSPPAAPEPSSDAPPSPVPTSVPSTTPSATPEPAPSTAAPAPSGSTAAPALRLDGDDLGVTSVGAPYADAVAALTAVLGPPVADPAPASACVGAGDREVEWTDFRLAVTDGRVSGWSSTDGRLATPSGTGIGTTVTELQEVYGDRLELHDAGPDSGPGFAVRGVELGGTLTGPDGDDRVTAFHNRACSPP